VTGVLAVALTAVTLPVLAARADGRRWPFPRLAALAPLAALVAVAGVAVAVTASWWLALLLSVPAALLLRWQLPPAGRVRLQPPVPGSAALSVRVLTLNVMEGAADPAAIVAELERHEVDVLAVQELTPEMAYRLAEAGVTRRLPSCLLDPRPAARGTGLWARWPLTPLPPLPGLTSAAPRARVEPAGGWSLTLTAVHAVSPTEHRGRRWQRELDLIRSELAASNGHQVLAGDFNASRDHRPFRDLLAAGFLDCADTARHRPWPGFTWPAGRGLVPAMRLDHVLISGPGATARESRTIQVPGTDHRAVLAVISLAPIAGAAAAPAARPQ
jgi:endonuclease/exonuclease/phosphatase (EEP) superfamily protein YafD